MFGKETDHGKETLTCYIEAARVRVHRQEWCLATHIGRKLGAEEDKLSLIPARS